ncbi:MAG: hypothetical protein DRP62_02330 [Planctomycetota bacterium]|nr:MAG: hypothetical protein DRP62_02330 [Planctomycetota bacterium]
MQASFGESTIMHRKLIDILIVDDDTIDRRLVERALKEPSQQLTFVLNTAATLTDGLECLKNHSFDLVLLDLGLPDSRGLETVDKLHQAYPQIPVIVLTGLADEETGVKAIKKGAIDYIVKPFKPDGLRTRIGIVLQIIELQQKLLSLANTDELTGLVNRRHFFDILEREVLQARIKGNSLSVVMFDIDHFKNINDAYGHSSGDIVLKQMGKILRENIYPLDVAARYGGDEFIVLMPEASSEKAAQAAERLRGVIDQCLWKVYDRQISITTSVGLADTDSGNLDSHKIIDKADAALYAAKRRGRNCVVRWDQIGPNEQTEKIEDRHFNELQAKVSSLVEQLRSQAMGMVSALIKAMNMVIKDPYIIHHAENAQVYAVAIAEEMGLSLELKERIGTAALLQDLGKITIPESILKKTTPLTEEEKQIIRLHPAAAAKILEPMGVFNQELQIIKHHHENFDGTGYPDRLKGKEIPIGAHILSVANAFDAITSKRGHHPAQSCEYALNEIEACCGTQFNPEVVEALKEAYEKHKEKWPLSTRAFYNTYSEPAAVSNT